MGLFSGIGSFFGGPIGGLLGGIGDAMFEDNQVDNQNSWNAHQAQLNRDFQKDMRATQWQTSVEDMKKAGINPMVAYGSGGAGNLSGTSTAPAQNKAASQQAASAASVNKATEENIRAQTIKTMAETDNVIMDTEVKSSSVGQIQMQTKSLQQGILKMEEEIREIGENINLKGQQRITLAAQGDLNKAQEDLAKINKALALSQIDYNEALTEIQKVLKTLRELDIPEAKALADYYSSAMGKAEPYAKGAQEYGGAIGGVINGALKGIKKQAGKTPKIGSKVPYENR